MKSILDKEWVIKVVETTSPNTSGITGFTLQTMSGREWMDLLRKSIIERITKG